MALAETISRRHPIPSSSNNPAPLAYEPMPPTSEHAARITRLGIEESLLRPSLPPRPPTRKPRSLAELPRDYKPTRFRLVDTPSSAGQGKSDAWFETLFGAVYARARRFAEAHFGGGDIPGAAEVDDSLWAGGKFGKEFLAHAGLVARQDNSNVAGGWEAVLRSGAERTALACGVVAWALEDGAWDRLLFGATGVQRRVLDELDRGMIKCDGYERTSLRAHTIDSLLGGASPLLLPENFWREVDLLTGRILALLLPLLDLVDAHFPAASATKPLAAVHADLHALVAEAGLLAVAMRRAADSVFRVVWPEVGDRYEWASQEHDAACEAVYTASKKAVEEAGNGEEAVAKVKVVVWPGLERYRRVGSGEGEGVDEVVIKKALVGYYCVKDGEDAAEERPRLGDYVAAVRLGRMRRTYGGRLVGAAAGVPLSVWLMAGAFLVLGLAAVRYPRYVGDYLRGTHQEPQAWGVVSFTSWLEWLGRRVRDLIFRPEVHQEPQAWGAESFISWLGRLGRRLRDIIFRGTLG